MNEERGPGRKTDGEDGASEGIRTLDIHLGKVTLYQTELRSRSEGPYECVNPEAKAR